MGLPAIKNQEHFTYGDYRTWPEEERWELIDGVAYNMSPAPLVRHQVFLGNLSYRVRQFLEGKSCKAFFAPVDVFFPKKNDQDENEVDTVVQPDLIVVCDPGKIREKGIWGAPDWVVEVLSPYTQKKDLREKYNLYERSGVKEYWIADPGNRSVTIFRLSDANQFEQTVVAVVNDKTDSLTSTVLPGFEVPLEPLFN